MPSPFHAASLRYGGRRTGIVITIGPVNLGLRWPRRVFNAPAGPFVDIPSRAIRLDATSLSRAQFDAILKRALASGTGGTG